MTNILHVTDYPEYLAMERQTLVARYLCVERDLATRKIEYAQTLAAERDSKARIWTRSVFEKGISPTAADKIAEHESVGSIRESILVRADVDVLEREAAMILFLLRDPILNKTSNGHGVGWGNK